jgi:acetyl-CoA C-acetyltransferase
MLKEDVFIVGAARTAVGSFLGMYSSTPAARLGATVIREALDRASIRPDDAEEVFMGCVLTGAQGQAPARQASLFAGVPDSVPCTTVGKVCGSGAQAIILGARTIALGENDLVVAGGMENMTMAPYAMPMGRTGYRMGEGKIVDEMVHDGLWDPYGNQHMGMFAEKCAEKYGFTREAQDEYAVTSYKRALAAIEGGGFEEEIVSVVVKDRKKGDVELRIDEEPRKFNEEKMRALKPAFKKDGTVTAGNASSINDGAAAVVLASARAVKERGLTPMARIVGWGGHAQAPEWFTTAPVYAMKKSLERCGLSAADIDVYEVNEAFAVVTMAAMKELELPIEKVNLKGSGCSIGHPIGCTGARLMVTLLYVMKHHEARRGLASMCIGGGEALSTIVESV